MLYPVLWCFIPLVGIGIAALRGFWDPYKALKIRRPLLKSVGLTDEETHPEILSQVK